MKGNELFEEKQVGKLYHFTSLINLLSILEKDILKANTDASVSFTRNKNIETNLTGFSGTNVDGMCEVRIEVDGDKLSNRYKIEPHNWYSIVGNKSDEAEERIRFANIKNIKKYITEITIYSGRLGIDYMPVEKDRIVKGQLKQLKQFTDVNIKVV